jgi:hypothetical protein
MGVLASLAGGCASYRVNTSLVPSKPAPVAQPETKYTITAVQYVSPTNITSGSLPAFGVYDSSPAVFPAKMMAAACRARPDIFSADAGAVPVEVTVTKVACDLTISGKDCVSCCTFTIFPLTSADKTDYTVEVTVQDPTAGPRKSLPITFSFEQRNWISFLPIGWIPVPGGKGTRVWGTESALKKTGDMMFDSCVEAAARALGHKEPSAWKAP